MATATLSCELNLEESVAEYQQAKAGKLDIWVAACCGTERPFSWAGKRFQYCYNWSVGKHAYVNLETGMPLSRAEEDQLFQ